MTARAASPVATVLYTLFALVAFAANSVLCRLALGEQAIDAASFTVIRLFSGAVVLVIIVTMTARRTPASGGGSWRSALMLFLYAVSFSFAYISLDTGTGALVLFGAVQITMILLSIRKGNRLHGVEWIGLLLACAGFVYLVGPQVTTPSLSGFVLMTIAGIAWGLYTLRGRGSAQPLADTAYNFVRTLPFVLLLGVLAVPYLTLSSEGILLAATSGALASGIGYTVWYMALGGLSATVAAVVQLAVPVIAAVGGVMFVAEAITLRLVVAAALVLGGIMTVVLGRYYFVPASVGGRP